MRTYKFRAYDKRFKKMEYGSPLSILYMDDNDHELMQWTGLKDKNGKEIYEGDICKVRHQTLCYASAYPEETQEKFMVDFIGVVEYREEQSLDGGFGGFYFEGKHSPSVICITTGEVIGNVWESPELLVPTPSK